MYVKNLTIVSDFDKSIWNFENLNQKLKYYLSLPSIYDCCIIFHLPSQN